MIIIDSITPIEHGRGSVASKYVLFADTKAEVPATGAATAAEITGFTDTLPPTTLLYTAAFEVAVLDTSDNWNWKE